MFVCLFVALATATLLPVVKNNPCRAQLNGSYIDIEHLLPWPISLYNIPGNSPEGVYDYYVDCRGQRTVCGSGVTVCQCRPNMICYNVGGPAENALWLADSFAIPRSLQILYPTKFLYMAAITFVNVGPNSGVNATLLPAGGNVESPVEQYNFDAVVTCSSATSFRQC